MAPKGECGGLEAPTLPAAALPPAPLLHPPPAEKATTVDDLTEEALHAIFRSLTPADLLCAALACHRWRRAASLALPSAPPLLRYFFHPKGDAKRPPASTEDKTHYPAVFVPLDASSPRLSLDLTPCAASALSIQDVHLGLVLLVHHPRPKSLMPRILAVDPASRRRVLLPAPTTAGAPTGASSASPCSRGRTRAGSPSTPSASPSMAPSRAPGSRPSATASAPGARCRGTRGSWWTSTRGGSRPAACTPLGTSTGTSATPAACSSWILARWSSLTCRCLPSWGTASTSTASERCRRTAVCAWQRSCTRRICSCGVTSTTSDTKSRPIRKRKPSPKVTGSEWVNQ
ncbi:unnamed protein product [Urochloa humidicola]